MVQNVLSVLPDSERVNLVFQRRVTRNLPQTGPDFTKHVVEGDKHIDRLRESGVELARAHVYEFGAGWDLIGPLTAYCAGVGRQTLVDIRPNVQLDLINDTISRLGSELTALGKPVHRPLVIQPVQSVSELERRFGIRYLAPCDARNTGLESESFDLISSTFTMEHIPRSDLAAILRESARLLKPEGVISSAIDMEDHYSYFDRSLSPYNFLKFSEVRWRLVNPPLHHQNRLRRSEYLALFSQAGFEVIAETPVRGDDSDLATVTSMPLAASFRRFSLEDLATKATSVVARRAA